MTTVIIYGLVDPITNTVRYVGKTINLRRRIRDHCTRCNKNVTHLNSWLLGLKNNGLKPEVFVVDEVDNDDWIFWEQHYISLFKSWGFKLLNMTIGGDNPPINKRKGYKHSEESRKRMSASRIGNKNGLGKKRSEETRQKLSLALKGKVPHNKGIPHSEETRRKIGLVHKGNKYTLGFKYSDESKKKMSKSRMGIKLSEETKKRMSVAKTGVVMDQQTRDKISAKAVGRPRNEKGVFVLND